MHSQNQIILVYGICIHITHCVIIRGHVQTIIGKINVIVTLGGRGVQGVTLRIAAEGKTVSKQGKFVSNHDVKSGEGGLSLTSQ